MAGTALQTVVPPEEKRPREGALTRDLWVARSPSSITIIDWRGFATKSYGRRDVDLDGDRRSGCGSAGRRGYSAEMKGAELNRRFKSREGSGCSAVAGRSSARPLASTRVSAEFKWRSCRSARGCLGTRQGACIPGTWVREAAPAFRFLRGPSWPSLWVVRGETTHSAGDGTGPRGCGTQVDTCGSEGRSRRSNLCSFRLATKPEMG
jgi:hypothetical protein